jgi:hypothetical protein
MAEKKATEKEFAHQLGKITIGTMDKKNCKSIYLKLSTYITPQYSLFECIDKIRRRLRANMLRIGDIYLDDFGKYLMEVQYNETSSMDIPGKKSYIAIELTLFPTDTTFVYTNDVVFALQNMGDTLFQLIDTIDDFELSPSRK